MIGMDLVLDTMQGSVSDLDIMASNRQSEFVSIDKQVNDDAVHLRAFAWIWKSRWSCVQDA